MALFFIKIHKILVKQTIIKKIRKKSLEAKKIDHPIKPYLNIQKKVKQRKTKVTK